MSAACRRYFQVSALLIHLCFAAFLLYWYRSYLGAAWVASVDLPGHVYAIERLSEQLLSGRIRFYDSHWFAGWPAFQFYAPLSHVLAAVLSFPLSMFSIESARLSAHLLLLASLLSIAPLLHLLVDDLLASFGDESQERDAKDPWRAPLLAVTSCAFGFWFLNHDRQWFGIGAAAALHVGLFSQALAWPLLLWYLRELVKTLRAQGRVVPLAWSFAAVFLCHSLTAAFTLFLALSIGFLNATARRPLFLGHILGFALSAWWLLPFAAYSGDYTGLDIYRPTGDFFELFFRYPLQGLIESVHHVGHGELASLELSNVVLLLLAIAAFGWTRLQRSKAYVQLGISFLLGLAVFSSGYVASSIPIGLHYYRFYAYLFLLLTVLLSVIPMRWYLDCAHTSARGLRAYAPQLSRLILLLVSCGSLVSNIYFPHYERSRIMDLHGEEQFENELQVLAYLRREPDVGRVYFSYFSNYDRYPFLSAHFFSSQLWNRNQQETINGLFIQSSLSYRMPVAAAVLLGIPGYHIPLLFTDEAELSQAVLLEQLRDSGVTHVVMGRQDLKERLSAQMRERIHLIGPYAILRIAAKPAPLIQAVRKPLIGYLDAQGTLPFRLFEMYFYSKQRYYSNFELISLNEGDRPPPGMVGLAVNGMLTDDRLQALLDFRGARLPEVFRFTHVSSYALQHYSVWYQHNIELDRYKAAEKTLDDQLRIPSSLGKSASANAPQASVARSADGQAFHLSGLVPGRLYRLNFSYFPYWSSDEASIFRGMPERIFVLPQQEEVTLEYRMMSRGSTWLGYALTAVALYFAVRLRRRKGRHRSKG